jgi:plastocyanin
MSIPSRKETDMRRSMSIAAGLIVLGACGGGGGGGTEPPPPPPPTLVHAKRVTATSGLAFDPSTVSIPAADTIYFTFQSVQHNVIFDTQGSPANVPNSQSTTVKRQFTTAGTFNYHCSIHPQMTGSVTVTP